MSGYVLSILGIVFAGVIIDIIVPNGSINKYIRSVYSIFVVAVILNPLISFVGKSKKLEFNFFDLAIDKDLVEYIYKERVEAVENSIEIKLNDNGFSNVDITIDYITENNQLIYKTCNVNLQNLVISSDNQHINKYEFIASIVNEFSDLTNEEIVFNE